MHCESAAAIVIDYNLPLTAEEFSEKIIPMYQERWPQVKPLPGANRLIKHLHKHGIPLALASNSVRKNVQKKISYQQGWKESFSVILGGDEVNHGKPSPDIYLESAKMMGVDPSRCLVIEDSSVGIEAAKAAGMKVVAIPSIPFRGDDFGAANCVLYSLLEFLPDQWGLPAFQDWVQSTLPIEPFYVSGVLRDGDPHGTPILMEHLPEENQTAPLPIQTSGVFFGWAKLGTRGAFKVVASIQWDISPAGARKLIRPHVLAEISSDTAGEKLRLLFVGFIRKLHRERRAKEGSSTTSAVSEEDKSVAAAALDLPAFADHKGNPFLADPSNPLKAYS
ncbi:unnamed protein product [Spirodela intermedia]|uniref:riboflavin kinase n=1 Tax=Spirodela intermedia TaxID=51605 RepID=A0A7I8KX04_SPIIN|nr:unnamed protein product [Spirodela intermedia]